MKSRGRDMQTIVSTIALACVTIAVLPFPHKQEAGIGVVPRAHAQHTEHAGPAQMRREFENESMLVLRIRMDAHEKTGMHDLTPRLVIWLTDAHLRDVKGDGTVTEYRRAAGTTEWVPAQRHAGENLSDQPVEFL